MTLHSAADSIRRNPDDGITIHDHQVSTADLSVVRAELHGDHIGQPNRRSTTVYAITSGTATFTLGDDVVHARQGDMVVSPPNTRRHLSGDATMIIINSPGFDPADEG